MFLNRLSPFYYIFIGGYTATGFIVDAEHGIILTNRHVVSPAPIVAQAVLTNYEEVDLKPVYRDPVHDFGFMKVKKKKNSYIFDFLKHQKKNTNGFIKIV